MGQQVSPGVWQFDTPLGPQVGKGADEMSARLDVFNRLNGQIAQGSDTTGGKKPATGQQDVVGRAKEYLLGKLAPAAPEAVGQQLAQGDVRTPGGTASALGAAGRAVGEAVMPGSLEELAVMAATGGAGRLGAMAGRAVGGGLAGQAARTATGVAAPAAAGAAAGAVKGESPLPGAVLGLMAGGIGEATRLAFQGSGAGIEKFTRYLRGSDVKWYNERVRSQIGPRLAGDIAADIPALREAGISMTSVPDVIKLLDDSTGRQVVGKLFDKVESRIAKQAGEIELPRDVVLASGRTDLIKKVDAGVSEDLRRWAGGVTDPEKLARLQESFAAAGFKPEQIMVPVSGVDAIAIAKALRHQSLRKGEGLAGRPARAMAEDVQARLDAAIGGTPEFSLGPARPAPSAAPNDIRHDILQNGRPVGIIQVEKSGTVRNIAWIGAEDGTQRDAPNIGISGLRDIARAFSVAHPEVKSVTGLRMGGAAFGAPKEQSVNLQQLAAERSPDLVAVYRRLRDDYSKFMDLRDWLVRNDPSKLFPGMVSKGGATIDLVQFGNAMMKDVADLSPSRFPNLHRDFTGSGGGTRAVGTAGDPSQSMGVHVPFTPLYVHPKGAKTKVPDVPATLDVGTMPPGPIRKAGDVAAGAGRAGAVAITPSVKQELR